MTHIEQFRMVAEHHNLLLDETRRTILFVEPKNIKVSDFASTGCIAFLFSDESEAAEAWSDVRQLPFARRPLIFTGDPHDFAATLPLHFDVVVWLDPAVNDVQRLDDAHALLTADGLLVRPVGETTASRSVAAFGFARPGLVPLSLNGVIDVVSLAARGQPAFARAFGEKDWDRLRIIYGAYHDHDGSRAAAEAHLQQMLLEFWAEVSSREDRPNRWPWRGRETRAPQCLLNGHNWPRISVVVPTFNQGQYIEETLLSLIGQAYENLELIVIDGGSTDMTDMVVRRYLPHIHHYVSEPDRGQSHAINKGMAVASGEILTWLNSDDMLAEGALHAMALAFAESGADLVAGICRTHKNYVYESEHLTACAEGVLPLEDILDLDGGWNAGKFFYQPEVFFSKRIWDKAGGCVREDLYYSMDYELWMRFAVEKARIHVIGRPIALFRRHEQQKTHVESRFKAELITVRDAFVERTGYQPANNPNGLSHRKLSFCFLNDIGFNYGAGIAHKRLAEAVVAAGHKVHALQLANGTGALSTSEELVQQIEMTKCDIVVLGNVHSASPNPDLFQAVFSRWPTLVVMHDFWWLTGRCAYTAGCKMFEKGCDASCPTPNEYPSLHPNDIYKMWLQKRVLLSDNPNVVLVANSLWTQDFVNRADVSIFNPADKIKLAIDPAYFLPRDKATARLVLGLPAQDFIVMLSTSDLNDPRKGALPIVKRLSDYKIGNLKVIILGNFADELRSQFGDMCVLPGYITDQEKLRLYYAAADLLIGGSREETFGQIFAEAAAIGTPSVAYGVTGVREAVIEDISGVLARTQSPDEIVRLVLMLKDRPLVRQQLHELAPIHFANGHSVEACYHSFYQVLHRAGLLDKIGVRTNITFTPREFRTDSVHPQAVEAVKTGRAWIGGEGVSPREDAYPDSGIPKPFSWLQGPQSEVRVRNLDEGVYWIAIEYQNILFEDLKVEIRVNDGVTHRLVVGASPYGEIGILYFKAHLKSGWNDLCIKFDQWKTSDADPRKLSLILTDVVISRAA